jgi:hypothetical protein
MTESKYQTLARPTQLYVACLVTTAFAGAEIAGIHIDPGAMSMLLGSAWAGAAWYTKQRTTEKLAGRAGDAPSTGETP